MDIFVIPICSFVHVVRIYFLIFIETLIFIFDISHYIQHILVNDML
jgi:hypothetical protein